MPPSSMTGFGRASVRKSGLTVTAEIRSTNHRYLKVSSRLPAYATDRTHEVEAILRSGLNRGAVDVSLRVQRRTLAQEIRLDEEAALRYYASAQRLRKKMKSATEAKVTDYLSLPGVIVTGSQDELTDDDWATLEECLRKALRHHVSSRKAEGRRLTAEIRKHLTDIRNLVTTINRKAPKALANHRTRLKERLDRTLARMGTNLDDGDVIREMAIYADRTDISEELERLRSHNTQFSAVLRRDREVGRELDFVLQEMFREINTIGSKASDAEISHLVVAVKVEIEKMREQVQNLE